MQPNGVATAADYRELGLFIDGDWTQGTAGSGEAVINPATEEALGYLPHASATDLDRAASAAVRAFEIWSRTVPLERKRILNKAANLLRERSSAIAVWVTLEQGKLLAEAKGEILAAADIFEWYGDECVRLYGRIVPSRMPGANQMVIREPIGPVAGFCPWNFPALTPARKIAGALAAGCTLVIKAAEETPATHSAGSVTATIPGASASLSTDSRARVTSLPRTMLRPSVKLFSSRICSISSQPALRSAGVMNLVQMSRSESPLLFIPAPNLPAIIQLLRKGESLGLLRHLGMIVYESGRCNR